MTNSADPDQLASSEANWSGATLFAKTEQVLLSKRRVLIVTTLWVNSADDQMMIFFLFSPENSLWDLMQIHFASDLKAYVLWEK